MKSLLFRTSMLFLVAVCASCVRDDRPQDTLVRFDTLPSCTEDFTTYTKFITDNQFGLSVQNLYHPNIFLYDSKKAPWRPINGRRETLGGRLAKYYVATVHPDQKEFDWNIDVVPGAAFAPWMGEGEIEGEVTPAPSLRDNRFFPPKGPSPLVGRNICLYGPWVRDLGNDSQREIHPAEAIWWRNEPGSNSDVQLIVVQDAAIHRFTERADYDFDEDHDGTDDFNPGWAPWVTYPQTEEIKIPFQYDPRVGSYAVITIDEERSLHVVTRLSPELDDVDNGAAHKLKAASRLGTESFNQPTLVEVHESRDSHQGIQFTDLCRSSTGIVSGNVRVLAAIGRANTRDAGFMVLRLTKSFKVNDEQVATQ